MGRRSEARGLLAAVLVSLGVHALAGLGLVGVSGVVVVGRDRTAVAEPGASYFLHEPVATPVIRDVSPPVTQPGHDVPPGQAPMPTATALGLLEDQAPALPAAGWSSNAGDPFSIGREEAPVVFAGLGAERASSVVYVVDGSGPMVTSMPMVVEELRRSLRSLDPSQRFGIVIFRDRSTTGGTTLFEEFRPGLVAATHSNVEAALAWLGAIRAEGASNPSDGLRRALAHQPAVVFLLARSIRRSGEHAQWGAGRDAILAELERLNPSNPATGSRPVQIKTLQFIEEDPTGIMQAIGMLHGGEGGHRVVGLEEVSGR